MIGILSIFTFFFRLIGIYLCEKFDLYKQDMSSLYVIFIAAGLFFAPIQLLYVFRMNVELGIPDIAVLILNTLISESLCACLVVLPLIVAFTKITPKRVEGTVFAFLSGTYNTAAMVSGISGTVFNQLFVGVT